MFFGFCKNNKYFAYFVHFSDQKNKINNLKDNIDVNQKKEPLTKLKEKRKGKNLKFELRTVSEKKVRKGMMGMKKKKFRTRRNKSREPHLRN